MYVTPSSTNFWGQSGEISTMRTYRGRIISSAIIYSKLVGKVLKGVKNMGSIKTLSILVMDAFRFLVMLGCERAD